MDHPRGYLIASYGMGGKAVEWWPNGLRELIARCRARGYETLESPYRWFDVNKIVEAINKLPLDAKIAIGGSSLGDDEAPDIAGRLIHRRITYLYGFQDSSYGVNAGVTANVMFADNIYNPSWWQTMGLGSRKWRRARNNYTTKLRNIPIYAPHPDDWGVAQDIVFSQIHRLLG